MPGVQRGDTGVQILDAVTVTHRGLSMSGQALGGRRARVALVALALAEGPVPADRLAAVIWADDLPATWPAALRGVVRGLRSALAAIGAGGQLVIATTPAGYRLAPGTEVDVRAAAAAVDSAVRLNGQGRHRAALEAARPAAALSGERLLPGEDSPWLEPYRRELDAVALRALELVAGAAGAAGEHHQAVAAGRRAVAAWPLDERSHRALISALHLAGDRAGAVQAYEQCRTLLAEQLGVDPGPETAAAYLAALGEQGTPGKATLPPATSAFFGRAAELARLAALISEPGLATVAGLGGIGKSRLAIQAAAAAVFPGGRLWVPLGLVARDELVASSVALALGIRPGAEDATAQLAAALAPLGRVLLILDGCEAVVDGVASLVTALVSYCPLLSVVVTSRVPLAVDGERVIAVGPLPGPDGAGRTAMLASLPLRLLADRVRAGGGRLDIGAEMAPYVAELCRRCGGVPLALELVAAQLAAMSVADLLDHLPEVIEQGAGRLRVIARSSYELLHDDEARVFRLLGVLDGPVALPLVRDMVAGGPIAPVRVVRILRELTARGLLAVDRSGPRWRYHQDDDLHRYARELLVSHGEERAALDRLAGAIGAIVPAEARTAPGPYLDAVDEVLPSVRLLIAAALDGRLDRDSGLELCFRLHRYWAATNVTEGRFWLSRLLADEPRSGWAAHARYALGYLGYWSGDAGAAISELRAAVAMLPGHQDDYAARALIYLGGLADDMDRGAEALDFVARSISAAAPWGADLQVSAAIGMGCVLAERADPGAVRYAAAAIGLCRRAGSAEQLAATLPTAAMICWQVGDLAAARRYIAEAQPLLAGSRRIARVVLLSAAAGVALADGDPAAAVEFGALADEEGTALGIDRELPLARAVLARAWLDRGDAAAAARHAAAAVQAARALSFTFPLAVCLETAAMVCLAGRPGRDAAGDDAAGDDAAGDRTAAMLLAVAARIRTRGDRPGMPALRAAAEAARASVAGLVTGPLPDPATAAVQAIAALGARSGALPVQHDGA